jgi:hypothetical protein
MFKFYSYLKESIRQGCVIQWHYYTYCVKIRYQENPSEGREDFMCAAIALIFAACNSVGTVIVTCSYDP